MHPDNTIEATVAYRTGALLGEGPVWDETTEMLYWVDIIGGKLFAYDPDAETNAELDVGGHLGAVALRKGGGIVGAMDSGFAFIDVETGETTPITDPESHLPGNRFNDGKCSPLGEFWAGSLSYDLEKGAGSLYCLNADLSVDVKQTGTTISNGLVWSRGGTPFYFVDSATGNVFSFDYDRSSGDIYNRSVLRHIEQEEGTPDGMTIDTEDHVWVALYGSGRVVRINPASGETVFEVHLPVPKTTSCVFGGSQFDELYITTAQEDMSEAELERAPLSGSLFMAKVPFQGYPAARFDG